VYEASRQVTFQDIPSHRPVFGNCLLRISDKTAVLSVVLYIFALRVLSNWCSLFQSDKNTILCVVTKVYACIILCDLPLKFVDARPNPILMLNLVFYSLLHSLQKNSIVELRLDHDHFLLSSVQVINHQLSSSTLCRLRY
jgi:hypothetical protein